MPAIRARKRPVVIDALLYTGDNLDEVRGFLGKDLIKVTPARHIGDRNGFDYTGAIGFIKTMEGTVTFVPGYWIMRGVAGEHYVCDPDIFAQTYDILTEET